jgi:multiple antibiotic resistance protein
MDWHLNLQELLTAFMVLFAVIDITGSIPIFINLHNAGRKIQAGKAAIVSLLILVIFLFAGEALLKLFHTDIASFAVAGSLVLFALAIEMTFDMEIFRNSGPSGYTTIVPVVFPLVAGPGTLTTTLSLRAECDPVNMIAAIALNMLVVYLVLKNVHRIEKWIGRGGIYILRKFFGVILLAMSVKLFVSNLRILLA